MNQTIKGSNYCVSCMVVLADYGRREFSSGLVRLECEQRERQRHKSTEEDV